MEVLHPRCCGLDVHKETVVACIRLAIDGKVVKESRTFLTTTADLIAMSEWLAENKCTHVAMEATGVYWKPVWHILADGGFELVLANAAHIKNVPGRKSDVKDADWISELLAHGLIRASFVPDGPTQEMRTFLRTRKQFVREKASHILRIQKTLEDANIKLDSVITDIIGVSGRKMIEALIAGESDPAKLANLADRRVKASQPTLREALRPGGRQWATRSKDAARCASSGRASSGGRSRLPHCEPVLRQRSTARSGVDSLQSDQSWLGARPGDLRLRA